MPALPWRSRTPIDPERVYTVLVSELRLLRYRSVPVVMAGTRAIVRQLASASGLVGYSLDADLVGRTFWTFSVWNDQDNLDAFVAADPHRRVMERLRAHMDGTRFHRARVAGSDIPASWAARRALLD